jgi:hypothetical protein
MPVKQVGRVLHNAAMNETCYGAGTVQGFRISGRPQKNAPSIAWGRNLLELQSFLTDLPEIIGGFNSL